MKPSTEEVAVRHGVAREAVLVEGRRFVEELEPALAESLRAGFQQLRVSQAEHAGRMDAATMQALEAAVDSAAAAGVVQVIERLRSPEIWLAPLTAPHLLARVDSGWPDWMPEWLAKAFGREQNRPELGGLDDPSNRIWVAISSAYGASICLTLGPPPDTRANTNPA